ncbi:ATP synthase F1 subcomplex epsilon subunit [Mycoplasma testudineum]|uniref:ATP synthase epsilon chain n=1 Tax=Mycoplasma testudineum TaxID=244584 RepID=A0A4R6IG39_9MOLU|nr:ATP synthase F1 subunit epsilon [Mycoplasma testudineum]OYD27134.1 ATP synthase F1 subunit epsilon [Mycoplasma testudineum]TDO21112.1 ATP synthase F1 subcomplex epsilon subunit [Mycoplasma testudineum]
MAKNVNLTITTPQGIYFNDMVDIVTVKTPEGYVGFMANHQPTLSTIMISTLYVNSSSSGKQRLAAIDTGLIYVDKEQITIVTSACEFAEDIDVTRARKAKEKAEEAIKLTTNITKITEEERRLSRSLNRLKVADQK